MGKWRTQLEPVLTQLESLLRTYDHFITGSWGSERPDLFSENVVPQRKDKPQSEDTPKRKMYLTYNGPDGVQVIQDRLDVERGKDSPDPLVVGLLEEKLSRHHENLRNHWGELFSICRRIYDKDRSLREYFEDGWLDEKGLDVWENWSDQDFLNKPKNYWTDDPDPTKKEFFSVPPNFGDRRPSGKKTTVSEDIRLSSRGVVLNHDGGDGDVSHHQIEGFSQFLYEVVYQVHLKNRRDRRKGSTGTYDCPDYVVYHRQVIWTLYKTIEEVMSQEEMNSYPVDQSFPTPYHYFKESRNKTSKEFDGKVEFKSVTGTWIERRGFRVINDPQGSS